jgi:glycosyltransferase involved in cell wall biosynthesis
MKIAIMMRAMDQDSGHQAIIMGLVENMLKIDQKNEYLLFYRTNKFFGRFSNYQNAKEILFSAPHKLLWDQVLVPYHAWKEGADVIYNPKFSVPLISPCPVVMGLHEPAWWAWPEHYEWFDRNYMKFTLPLYIRKAKHLFPISRFVIDENKKYINFPFKNVTIVYPAPKAYFKQIEDDKKLKLFRQQYNLPEKFILSVTRVDHPGVDNSVSFFRGKNVETTVRAYNLIKENIPHKLVIAGRRVKDYLLHLNFTEKELEGILFLGFVKHEELPKLLNLAKLFVLPSYYESYAMALVEAMTCGCPIVASQTGACPEIVKDAALLADPYNPKDFAERMLTVLQNENLQKELSCKGLKRASAFKWENTSKLTIESLVSVIKKYRKNIDTARRTNPASPKILNSFIKVMLWL